MRGRCCRPGPGSTPPASWRPPPPARIGCLVLLGADPLADFPDRDLARRALAGPGQVVALDAFLTASSSQADVVLAVAAFGEKTGTTTNLEGRVSPVAQKVTAAGTAMEDWMIAVELAERLGADLGLDSVAAIAAEAAAVAGPGSSFTGHRLGRGAAASSTTTTSASLVDRELYDAAVFTARSPSLADLPRGAAVGAEPVGRRPPGLRRGHARPGDRRPDQRRPPGPARRARAPRCGPPRVQPARRRASTSSSTPPCR